MFRDCRLARRGHCQLDCEKFSNGCRYSGDPEARYSETMNCRCTLVAAVDGVDQDAAERWSRLLDGMTYEQWKGERAAKQKAAAGSKPTAAAGSAIDKGAAVYKALSPEQVSTVESILAKSNPKARAAYLASEGRLNYLGKPDEKSAFFTNEDKETGGIGVRLKPSEAFDGSKRPSGTTWFHEFGHHLDYLSTGSDTGTSKRARGLSYEKQYLSSSFIRNVFGKTLKREANDYINARNKQMKKDFGKAIASRDAKWLLDNDYIGPYRRETFRKLAELQEHKNDLAWLEENGARRLHRYRSNGTDAWYAHVYDEETLGMRLQHSKEMAYKSVAKEISAMTDAQKADVSDLFTGATLNKCEDGWRHEKSYWKPKNAPKDYECIPLAHEGFAEFFSAYTANPESLEMLRKYFPESSIIFEELLKEVSK